MCIFNWNIFRQSTKNAFENTNEHRHFNLFHPLRIYSVVALHYCLQVLQDMILMVSSYSLIRNSLW